MSHQNGLPEAACRFDPLHYLNIAENPRETPQNAQKQGRIKLARLLLIGWYRPFSQEE